MIWPLLVAVVATVDPADLPPPPPLLDAPAPAADPAADAPPVVAAPALPSPPAPPTPAAPASPPSSAPAAPAPSVHPPSHPAQPAFVPLDPLLVGALQALVPCGVTAVAIPCTLLGASVCPGALCVGCLLPAASAYLSTYVGDRFGPSRAPIMGPLVASYIAAAAAVIGGGVVYYVVGAGGANSDPVALTAGGGGALLVVAIAIVAVPVSYALTAEPKAPGDDGSATPGWLEPARPASPPAPPHPARNVAY